MFFPPMLQDLCYGKEANANGLGYVGKVDGGNGIGNGNGRLSEMEM